MKIKADVPFVRETVLEMRANALLERYHREIGPIVAPPVPVEGIADFLLEIGIDVAPIPDTDDDPILALIHAESSTIRFNESRLDYFTEFMGSYEFTLAHEIGHYELHMVDTEYEQLGFGFGEAAKVFVCRDRSGDRREIQANRFAAYLLMPSQLLLPAIEGADLARWPELYRLRDMFKVSISALTIRLKNLGLLHMDSDGKLYRQPTLL